MPQVTSSTEGDAGPAAALDLDTAPVAGRNGTLAFQRVIRDVPDDVLDDLHIHGKDLDGGTYDPEPITALGAPLGAELPVACGELDEDDRHDRGNGRSHGKGHDHGDRHARPVAR